MKKWSDPGLFVGIISALTPICSIISAMKLSTNLILGWLPIYQLRLTRLFPVWLPILLLGLYTQSALGLQITGLYSYKLEVLNESNSERNRAFSDALAAVIVKVTGEQRWLLDPVVVEAVSNAQSYVERVSYSVETRILEPSSAEVALPEQPTTPMENVTEAATDADPTIENSETAVVAVTEIEQRYINVDFSESLINELLTAAKIPVWDSNRPSVLVWMALQDEAGERSFLNQENHPEIVELIRAFADKRGLPVIFPVFDFEDRQNVDEDTIWSLDEEIITTASARYGADSIMAGRLHFTAGGELVGVWQFLFQDQWLRFDSVDLDLESYINAPLDKITTQLASYFAIVPETNSLRMAKLRVDGVGTLREYSSLMNYINGLGLVESVTTTALDGERLELSLSLVGDPNQLAELIALDRDLLPIGSESLERDISLHYRWTR